MFHAAPSSPGANRTKSVLRFSLVATLAYVAVTFVAGLRAHSLALLSEAGHNVSDFLALLLSFAAVYFSPAPPATPRPSATSAPACWPPSSTRLRSSSSRSGSPSKPSTASRRPSPCSPADDDCGRRRRADERRHRRPAVGRGPRRQPALGLPPHGRRHALHRRRHRRRRGHPLTGQNWIDPVLSLLIAALILWSSIGIVRETLNILLEGTPRGVSLPEIRSGMEAVEGVSTSTTCTSGASARNSRALACHVTIADIPPSESACILVKLNHVLKEPLPDQPHHHPVRAHGLRGAGRLRRPH
jgi:cobalt-zinc-cadmium efflux system protein